MPARPRVLLVSARYPPDQGGVETHVAEVAPRLARLGLEVGVLTTDRTGERPRREVLDGVAVQRIAAYPKSRDYYLAPGLAAAIRSARPDLVHLQGYHTLVAPMAMMAAETAGIPYVVSFHSGGHTSSLRQRMRGTQRLALRPLLRRAARLIAVSRYEQQLFSRELRLAPGRFRLVRNGSTMPTPRSRGTRRRSLVLSVGRLERYKGHHRLVDAWPAVRELNPSARLRIIGTGPDEAWLRERIDRAGLAGVIEVGSIPAGDRQLMADTLAQAGLVALLSDYEAHPVAVMEALAVGTPVIVTRTSGLTELADDGLAAGIDPSASPSQVAQAIAHELRHPRSVDVPALPTWDDTARQLHEIYRQVLEAA